MFPFDGARAKRLASLMPNPIEMKSAINDAASVTTISVWNTKCVITATAIAGTAIITARRVLTAYTLPIMFAGFLSSPDTEKNHVPN